MILSPMRFKTFVWPHNPRVYSITFERKFAVHKIPFGRYHLQSLGQTRRVLKGEGEFAGKGAYDTFRALGSLFYDETPGTLVHPLWMTTTAWFAGLELRQEPRQDYVAYSFEFWEVMPDGNTTELTPATVGGLGTAADGGTAAAQGEWYTVVKGDTLWELSRRYGVSVSRLVDLNPDIRNPNLIYVGQRVRLQ